MIRKLIKWALNNPLVVLLLAVALAAVGFYSFMNVNVECYPDPRACHRRDHRQFPRRVGRRSRTPGRDQIQRPNRDFEGAVNEAKARIKILSSPLPSSLERRSSSRWKTPRSKT